MQTKNLQKCVYTQKWRLYEYRKKQIFRSIDQSEE